MPNFSSLAGLEVTEKFVCGWGGVVVVVGSKWLLCLTSTKLLLSCFELRWVLTMLPLQISRLQNVTMLNYIFIICGKD